MDDKTGIDDADMAQALSARAGDRRAFAGLVRRHQDRMFGFLLRMLGTRDEAMDVTQDSFLKAWRALPDWRPEARFTTWLFQIARNAALDLLRHRQRIEFVSVDADPAHDMVEDTHHLHLRRNNFPTGSALACFSAPLIRSRSISAKSSCSANWRT